MGCFLACLGSSKHKKGKRLHSNRIPSGARDQRRGYNPVEQVVYPGQRIKHVQQVDLRDEDVKPVRQARPYNEKEFDRPTSLVSVLQNKAVDEFDVGSHEVSRQEGSPRKSNVASPSSFGSREKSADKSSSGAKKKVSFNSVVKTYEPVPNCELLDEELIETEKIGSVAKSSNLNAHSGSGSNASSVKSYPPNHRYQNCRESDDEEEELDYEESDIDFEDEDEDGILEEDELTDGDVLSDSLCSNESTARIIPEETSHMKISDTVNSSLITRGREGFDQSVLNPVENLSQWKALKSNGKKTSLQLFQKENSTWDIKEPPAISFSHEPKFNQPASLNSKLRQPEHKTQGMAVDASLSNWLTSPEPPKISKANTNASHNVIPQQTASQGSYSHSPQSLEDRPILGALTVEELKLISRNSSPRKSPSKSPDDMAIIGSVGSYWSREKSDKDSSPVSSQKGLLPNTTSKYREDMRVNWDSTPFETRLEKALSEGSAEA